MKRLLGLLIIGAVVACSKLDLVPLGELSSSNFPLTDGDAITLVNAVYQPNVGISTALGYLIDLTSELEANAENTNSGGYLLGVMQWDPNNSYVNSVWTAVYNGVSRANDVIDKVSPANTITPTLKDRLLGEAHFLRAYYYFYAVQFWGEVPLVIHNIEGSNTTRAAVDEVYQQIIQDLTAAANLLPTAATYPASDKGRASKGAALAYLAKVYLVYAQTAPNSTDAQRNERLQLAVDYANQVDGYALEEEFLHNWAKNNRNGKESIFATQHVAGQVSAADGGNHLVHCAFASGYSTTALPHVYATSDKWWHDFDDRDQRKRGTYIKELHNPAGELVVFDRVRYAKYIDTTDVNASANSRDINRTILRYAEVLLVKAEALNELHNAPNAEAYEAINQVRRRAFRHPINSPSTDDLPAGLDYTAFRDHLRQERVFELTYEQNRWTDLVRWRVLVKTLRNAVEQGYISDTYLKQNVQLHYYRFPIPKSQRDINPTGLWQNYGYDGYDPAITGANPYNGFE